MRIPGPVPQLLLAAALALLSGCREYQVGVELAADWSGTRTTTLETTKKPSPEALRLLGLDGDGWQLTAVVDHEGAETYRYRRRQQAADPAGWQGTGGVVLRADAGGEIALVTEVTVTEEGGAEGDQLVYRETLSWTGLQEAVAAQVSRDYAGFLSREFSDLPDSLVDESRAVLAETVTANWSALTGDEENTGGDVNLEFGPDRKLGASPEATLDALFNPPQTERFERAGVAPDLARLIAQKTSGYGYFEGVKTALPGLETCFQSIYNLTVVMPGPVTGGNADTVAGSKASFRVELSGTLAAPVTLEVIGGR